MRKTLRLAVAALLLAGAVMVVATKAWLEGSGPYLESLPLHPFCGDAVAALADDRVAEAIEVAEAGGCQGVVEEARGRWNELAAVAERCWDGVWTGRGDDDAGVACAIASDLVVFGDVRDLTRQGAAWVRGDETDSVLIALSTAGIVLTAAPAAGAGTSLLKLGRRVGTLGRGLADDLVRLVRGGAWGSVRGVLTDANRLSARLGPAKSVRALAYADDATELAHLAAYVERTSHPLLALRWGGQGVVRLGDDALERVALARGPRGLALALERGGGALLSRQPSVIAIAKSVHKHPDVMAAWASAFATWLLRAATWPLVTGLAAALALGGLLLAPRRGRRGATRASRRDVVKRPAASPSEAAVVATAMLTGVLAPLNSTMIVVALPQILADTGATLTWGTWIVLSYLVAMAAVQPLGGSLGDRFGRRRLLHVGLATFSVASLAAALAPSVELLVIARTAQAIAGAIAIPNGTALVRALVEPSRHGAAFGLVGAGIGVAAALGPPLGGLVADALGWRWIFAANLLVLVPAVWMTSRLPRGEARGSGRFDVGGALLLLTTLVAAALAMTLWRVPEVPLAATLALAGTAVAAALRLRVHVARVSVPVIDFAVLARPGFLPAGLSVLFMNLTMYTVLLAVPVFLTRVAFWAPRDTGLVLAGMSVLMLVGGPIGGWLSDRIGRRAPALAGALVAAAGTLPLTLIAPSWSWPAYLAALAVIGAGVGLTNAPVQAAALQAVAANEAGRAAGLFSTMRYTGSILGSAAMAAILADGSSAAPFRLLFALLVLTAVVAAVTASRLPRPAPAVTPQPRSWT